MSHPCSPSWLPCSPAGEPGSAQSTVRDRNLSVGGFEPAELRANSGVQGARQPGIERCYRSTGSRHKGQAPACPRASEGVHDDRARLANARRARGTVPLQIAYRNPAFAKATADRPLHPARVKRPDEAFEAAALRTENQYRRRHDPDRPAIDRRGALAFLDAGDQFVLEAQ